MSICFIHVGTHKTGTSSIQTMLRSNREALAAAGVYVPETGHPSSVADNAAHHNIAWELNGEARFNPADGTFSELVAEIAGCGLPVAVISSELFSHLAARPAALRVMRAEFESIGCTPRIVAYLRPQGAYAQSLYLEHRKHGFTKPFAEYADAIIKDGKIVKDEVLTYEFTYTRLLSTFETHFGAGNVIARRYLPEATSLLDDFVGVIATAAPAISLDQLQLPERMNENPHKDRLLKKLMESGGTEHLARLERKFSVDYITALVRYGVQREAAQSPGM
jgi:hypothetical protein